MTQAEYERLQKANQLHTDLLLMRDAVAILKKRPRMSLQFAYMDDDNLISTAMARFFTNEDLAEIFSRKIESIEMQLQNL